VRNTSNDLACGRAIAKTDGARSRTFTDFDRRARASIVYADRENGPRPGGAAACRRASARFGGISLAQFSRVTPDRVHAGVTIESAGERLRQHVDRDGTSKEEQWRRERC
jgi:hypothetical protein